MNVIVLYGITEFPKSILMFCNSSFCLLFIFIIFLYFFFYITYLFLCLFHHGHYIESVSNLSYCIFHSWLFFNSFISTVRASLNSSILFSCPVSVLMIIALNSPSNLLFISVSISSLAVTLSYCFIWNEFLHLCILSKSLSSSMC